MDTKTIIFTNMKTDTSNTFNNAELVEYATRAYADSIAQDERPVPSYYPMSPKGEWFIAVYIDYGFPEEALNTFREGDTLYIREIGLNPPKLRKIMTADLSHQPLGSIIRTVVDQDEYVAYYRLTGSPLFPEEYEWELISVENETKSDQAPDNPTTNIDAKEFEIIHEPVSKTRSI